MLAHVDCLLTDEEFQRISALVHRHCGINLHSGKRELVQARIIKRINTCGCSSVAHYLELALADASGREFRELVDALSTNLTSFFREGTHFAFLQSRMIPDLVKRKEKAGRRIRGWSAGCSTGEEPYTLAVTLSEALAAFGGVGVGGWDVKLLATDISNRVLRTAKAGLYEKGRVETVPSALRSRYFIPARGQAGMCEIAPALRGMIQFAYLNLMEPWPFSGPFDFVFCRNVMIYFDKPTQERLVNRFYDVLAPGGMLFTGHSESLTGVSHRFTYVQPTVYARP